MNSQKYVGMDVHQATISIAVMDDQGKLIMECILETKAATIWSSSKGRRIDCPCHHASDRQYRSHAFYRAQRHQWEVGLSSPNRILDKTRKHCRAATSFWHQRLRPRRDQLLFIELIENWPPLVNERNGDLSPSSSLASHTLESGGCMQV